LGGRRAKSSTLRRKRRVFQKSQIKNSRKASSAWRKVAGENSPGVSGRDLCVQTYTGATGVVVLDLGAFLRHKGNSEWEGYRRCRGRVLVCFMWGGILKKRRLKTKRSRSVANGQDGGESWDCLALVYPEGGHSFSKEIVWGIEGLGKETKKRRFTPPVEGCGVHVKVGEVDQLL